MRPKEKKTTETIDENEDNVEGLDDARMDVDVDVDEGREVDMDMDIDVELGDALEYVDLDQLHRNAEAGPSRLLSIPSPSPSVPAPVPPAPTSSTSIPLKQKTKSKDKGKQKASTDESPSIAPTKEVETEEPTDPAMRIDRLTGISPPLTRAPRGTGKKGKQKEKADG